MRELRDLKQPYLCCHCNQMVHETAAAAPAVFVLIKTASGIDRHLTHPVSVPIRHPKEPNICSHELEVDTHTSRVH